MRKSTKTFGHLGKRTLDMRCRYEYSTRMIQYLTVMNEPSYIEEQFYIDFDLLFCALNSTHTPKHRTVFFFFVILYWHHYMRTCLKCLYDTRGICAKVCFFFKYMKRVTFLSLLGDVHVCDCVYRYNMSIIDLSALKSEQLVPLGLIESYVFS